MCLYRVCSDLEVVAVSTITLVLVVAWWYMAVVARRQRNGPISRTQHHGGT